MSEAGKGIRTERIMNRKSGNMVIIPMDHGVGSGPIKGLVDLPQVVNQVAKGGANAVLGHPGLSKHGHRGYGHDVGLIIHLSASTALGPDSNHKVLVTTVEEAIRMGADAVSVHINVGAEDESKMLQDLGLVARQCDQWGMPLLAMMYPRGKKVDSEYNVEYVKHAARIGAELGADIVKTNYTGDIESFKEVVDGCLVPVIIAGGPINDNSDQEFLSMVYDAMKAGARGVAIGRNVFGHLYPKEITQAISSIVHKGISVEDALSSMNDDILKNEKYPKLGCHEGM